MLPAGPSWHMAPPPRGLLPCVPFGTLPSCEKCGLRRRRAAHRVARMRECESTGDRKGRTRARTRRERVCSACARRGRAPSERGARGGIGARARTGRASGIPKNLDHESVSGKRERVRARESVRGRAVPRGGRGRARREAGRGVRQVGRRERARARSRGGASATACARPLARSGARFGHPCASFARFGSGGPSRGLDELVERPGAEKIHRRLHPFSMIVMKDRSSCLIPWHGEL